MYGTLFKAGVYGTLIEADVLQELYCSLFNLQSILFEAVERQGTLMFIIYFTWCPVEVSA